MDSANAPQRKRDKFGADNPFMADFPSEFRDVPAGPGLERRESGKVAFGTGNKFAQIGNLNKAKKRAIYQKAIEDAVTLDDIYEIVRKCVEQAKAGVAEARAEILNRTAGKVTDKVEIEGGDGSGWTFSFKLKEPDEVFDLSPREELPPRE